MTKVLYPGSFDPITRGHMNIIAQATLLFDEVIIAVLQNPLKKSSYFSLEERLEILNKLYYNNSKVKLISSTESAADVALKNECIAIIRGLRNGVDFNYEIQLAQINRDITNDKINTICLFADPTLQMVSSSVVKEVFSLGKSVSKYVDPIVEEKMLLKRRR